MSHTNSQFVPRVRVASFNAGLKPGDACYLSDERHPDHNFDRKKDCPEGYTCMAKAHHVMNDGLEILHCEKMACDNQKSCDACHEASSDCRWAEGTCIATQQDFNSARECPTRGMDPVIAPATTSSMCVECIEGGGMWQAGKCTTCQDGDAGYCYETKESCSLWVFRAAAVERCPQQNSCYECLSAHPYCRWMASEGDCIGYVGQRLNYQDMIKYTKACPLWPAAPPATTPKPTTTQSTTTTKPATTTRKSPPPDARADGCGCC